MFCKNNKVFLIQSYLTFRYLQEQHCVGSHCKTYDAIKTKVSSVLKMYDNAVLTFDGWTDKYQKLPFLGLRAAVITPDWKRRLFTQVVFYWKVTQEAI